MNLRQFLLILRLRWWLVLTILALVLAGALAFSLTTTKRYLANTSLILDLKPDPLLSALAPVLAAPSYMLTQAEIIQSDRVSGRVVRMMGLAESPVAVAQWRESTDSKIPLETYFGQLLRRGLIVTPGKGNQILNISFLGTDPNFAAAAANTFARAYIDLSVELRTSPARENATFFDERMQALRADLEAARAKVTQFQQSKGLIITADRFDEENARLASLESALASALAEQATTSTVLRNTGSETSVDVAQSGVVQGIRSQLATAETKLAEASLTLGASHPLRIQLDTQISELKAQLARETKRVGGTSASVNRVTGQKITELRALAEAQKRTVLEMRARRDDGAFLLKELDVAQRAYEAVASRRSQLSLELQADQAGARVLSPATAPLSPASPDVQKNMVAAAVIGLLLGIVAAMAWEFLDRRVRSEDDLMSAVGVPVLSVLTTKPGKSALVRRLPPPRAAPQLTMNEGVG
jgi:chain length determinant protein EpsF